VILCSTESRGGSAISYERFNHFRPRDADGCRYLGDSLPLCTSATAIIVLLVLMITHATQIASAVDRVVEVALGGVTGFIVSVLLWPSKAHPLIAAAAARTLNQMASALGELLAGLMQGRDVNALHRIQDGIGQALVELNVAGAEAGARAVGRSCRGARYGAAVAHTAQVAPRSCDNRKSGRQSPARGLRGTARIAAGTSRRRFRRLLTCKWSCIAGRSGSAVPQRLGIGS
jgi:uncharacterized membrane protein YccC